MKTGWNLGNTFDAIGSGGMASETSWGQPLTTKAMIDGLAASGIKTIRIPVSWNNHITDRRTYTIHPDWMARVKEVVDWAIANDMYVIINSHHDNYEKPSAMLRGASCAKKAVYEKIKIHVRRRSFFIFPYLILLYRVESRSTLRKPLRRIL